MNKYLIKNKVDSVISSLKNSRLPRLHSLIDSKTSIFIVNTIVGKINKLTGFGNSYIVTRKHIKGSPWSFYE